MSVLITCWCTNVPSYTFHECTCYKLVYIPPQMYVLHAGVQMYPLHYVKNVPSYMFHECTYYMLVYKCTQYTIIKKITYYTSGYKCTPLRVGYSKMASP